MAFFSNSLGDIFWHFSNIVDEFYNKNVPESNSGITSSKNICLLIRESCLLLEKYYPLYPDVIVESIGLYLYCHYFIGLCNFVQDLFKFTAGDPIGSLKQRTQ